jgi:acyl transferase domain-containing protein
MVALLGAGAAEQAQELADAHGLAVANDNSPQQVVLSGLKAELPNLVEHASELGLRAMELDVAGAFHSPMMEPAVGEFSAALASTEFRSPGVPVISAVTVKPFTEPRRELADALTSPVRWRETMLALHQRGAGMFVEVGPGRVLTGLAKRTLKGVELAGA